MSEIIYITEFTILFSFLALSMIIVSWMLYDAKRSKVDTSFTMKVKALAAKRIAAERKTHDTKRVRKQKARNGANERRD